jgi:hypothetical protein
MAEYLAEVRIMEKFFNSFKVWYVTRLDNLDIDHLAWIASSIVPTPLDVIIKKLSKPSVKAVESSETTVEQNLMIIDEPKQ